MAPIKKKVENTLKYIYNTCNSQPLNSIENRILVTAERNIKVNGRFYVTMQFRATLNGDR